MPQCILILNDSESNDIIRRKAHDTKYSVRSLRPPFGFVPSNGDDRSAWILRTFDALAASLEARLEHCVQMRGVPMCTAVVDIQPEPVVDLRDLNPLRNEPQFCCGGNVGSGVSRNSMGAS